MAGRLRRGSSNLGDGIALAAGPLLVASQTSDPLLVALAALLQRLPWLLFGLYAGVLADRVDRRRSSWSRSTCCAPRCSPCWPRRSSPAAVDVAVVLVAMFLLGTAEVFADTTSAHAAADGGRQARTSASATPG